MVDAIKHYAPRLLQGCISIIVGFWLPQELFVFSTKKLRSSESKPLKRIVIIVLLSITTIFISIVVAIYFSFNPNFIYRSHDNWIVPLVSILFAFFCIIQAIRYLVQLRFSIGIICLIPIALSFFIIHKPYGMTTFNGNVYVKIGYTLVWPLIERKYIKNIQKMQRNEEDALFVMLNDFEINNCVTRTLVYDESDEIANPKGLHLKYWLYRNKNLVKSWHNGEPILFYNEKYADKPLVITMYKLNTENIKGHFYIVYENICNSRGYGIKIDIDSYEIIKWGCSTIEIPIRESCPDQWK